MSWFNWLKKDEKKELRRDSFNRARLISYCKRINSKAKILCGKDPKYSSISLYEIEKICKSLWKSVATMQYIEFNWDCDNFADKFKCSAHEYSAKNEFNIACAYVEYMDEKLGHHAINCILLNGGEIVFIEPQKCKIIELSRKEKSSIVKFEF